MNLTDFWKSGSKSFREVNSGAFGTDLALGRGPTNKNEKLGTPRHELGHRRGKMNKTETEFALILEAQKRKGEILRYEFEGITLRFAGVKYTPDFVVFSESHAILHCSLDGKIIKKEFVPYFIEIKGAYCKGKFERAVERFRHARTYWKEFQFELHQKQKTGWKQIC